MATTVWVVLGVLIVVAFLFYGYAVRTAADVATGDEIADTEVVTDTRGVAVRCSDCGRTIQIGFNRYTVVGHPHAHGENGTVGSQRITLRNIVEEIAEHRVTDCAMAD